MNKTEKRYVLRNKKTGKDLEVYTSSNGGGDFCNDEEYILSPSGDRVWYASSPQQAEFVRLNKTEWFNASEETPNHSGFDPKDYYVVEQFITIEETVVDISIPTPEELYSLIYKNSPERVEYLLKEKDLKYSIYDLREYFKKKG